MPVGLYEKALPRAMGWEERLAAAGQASVLCRNLNR
jgi:L-ribulose-5-phosphate 3-epimerase UlaE